MRIHRRQFFGAAVAAGAALAARADAQVAELPESIRKLRPLPAGPKPISDEERQSRMEKAGCEATALRVGVGWGGVQGVGG